MTHVNRFQRVLVLWTLLFSLCAAGTGIVGAAQPIANDPMKIIPADALFCLRINKLTTSLAQVDQFLTGISPFGVSMPVRSQLGQFLGAPEPAGINMAGDIAVFGPLPGGEKPDLKRVGVLVPLSDFQQFLTNPNVAKPDAQGILKIGPEGKQIIAGVRMGSYLLLTGVADQQALTEAKNWTAAAGAASLAQRLGPDELKRATDSPAWAYANVQVVAKMYGPMIQQKIKEFQKNFQQMQAKGGPMPVQPEALMGMYTSMLDSFMQETQFVSLSIDPSASAIRVAPVVAAVPNSEMGKILSLDSSQPLQPSLMGYLENGAIMNGVAAFSPAFAKAVEQKRVDLVTALMGQAMSKEDVARIRKLAMDAADACGGAGAWSFSTSPGSKPPFRMKYVIMLKDKQKFSDALDQSAKMMNEGMMTDLLKKFGVKMQCSLKRNAQTYQGVAIDAISVAIQPADANSPQAQMMKSMFGETFNLRLAVVNNLLLYTLAADPEKEIHALIDQAKAGGPGQIPSEVQSALQLIPEVKKANFFGTYNYVRAIQMAMGFMPMPMPQMDVPTQSDVAIAGSIGNGKLLLNLAIPKQHVLELMQVIMRMQQQKMPSKPPQEGQK